MALGCPVIVPDRGALPEVVGGHGHVVGIEDYEEVACLKPSLHALVVMVHYYSF